MSWYIQTLLRNSFEIRNRIYPSVATINIPISFGTLDIDESEKLFDELSYDINFEDEDYHNLLQIEKTILTLIKNNQLTKKEIYILREMLDHTPLTTLEERLKLSRYTIVKIFSNICNRVAFILGDGFTDEGFLENFRIKYKLTPEELIKARNYMKSNRRFIKLE